MIPSIDQVALEYLGIKGQLQLRLGSNDKSPKNLRKINSLQSSLSDLADHVFYVSCFFTKQRVDEIYGLLVQAGEYLRGTMYEAKALERPERFRYGAGTGKEAAESITKLKRTA